MIFLLCLCLAAGCIGCTEPAPSGEIVLPREDLPAAVSSDGWLTLGDAVAQAESSNNGVFAPLWFACGQSLCRTIDYDFTAQSRVKPAGKVYFRKDYTLDAYAVEADDGLVAVILNGQFVAYRKLLTLDLTVLGAACEMLYSPVLGTDYELGEKLQEADGFSVYAAVSVQMKEETQYIVDATQLLKTSLPEEFGSCGLFREFYWVAQKVVHTPEYLQEVAAQLSAAVTAGELPEVVSVEVSETRNCVAVALKGITKELEEKIRAFDPKGSAIKIAVGCPPAPEIIVCY